MGNLAMASTGCCCNNDDRGTMVPAEEFTAAKTTEMPKPPSGPEERLETSEVDEATKQEPPQFDKVDMPQRSIASVVESSEEIDWEIELRRTASESALGLSLYVTPNQLVVQSVPPGMLRAWNLAHPDKEVRKGTVIMEVNGIQGDAQAIFGALRADPVLKMKLKRVAELKVHIEKRGKLGLDVNTNTMEVKQVKENGCIDEYNRSCKPGYQMSPGDTIIAVNNVSEDISQMLREIHSATGSVTFTIKRD